MAKFARPANAIETFEDLKLGDVVYSVLGIWPPQTSRAYTVVGAPMKFSEHTSYSGIHETMKDYIVFDLKHDGYDFIDKNFASDNNLMAGQSHNDNYLFRTAEDAQAARLWLREQWVSSDGMIAEFEANRAMWSALDDDYYDYDYRDQDAA